MSGSTTNIVTHDSLTIAPKSLWLANTQLSQHAPEYGLNPLIDAAAQCFATLSEIKATHIPPNASGLFKRLKTEINAFQQYIAQEYTHEICLASQYALCATFDDAIMNTEWGAHDYWESHRLLTQLQNDHSDGERFFMILEHVKQQPEVYSDLLEFLYVCLRLGFKGQYRSSVFSFMQLNQLTDQLYHLIRGIKGETQSTLSPNITTKATTPIKKPLIKKMVIRFGAGLFVSLITLTVLFNMLFDKTTDQLIAPLVTQTSTGQSHE
ncbi:MAG: type IVB secretion system protein IcmH/DotU [Gammaproteobacteria bacterium]